MKFLYSHRTRSADGQYVHIRELTGALRGNGHEVIMAGPDGTKESCEKKLSAKDASLLKTIMPSAFYEFAELAYSAPAYWRLRKLYSQTQPDILYQRYNLFYYPGAWLSRATHIPFMLEVNAPLAEERAQYGKLALKGFAASCEKEVWRAADKILPVTNVLAERLRATGLPEEKIAVIHNGVSDIFLKDHDQNSVRRRYGVEEKLVLGFAGFVRDWHGVDRVIRYLARQDRNDLHFLLVGDGPARERLENLATECGVSDQLTITGVVQRDDLPGYIAAFDVAVQPAVVEYASPLKLFEYMALAKAILAPDSANIREVLTDGNDALLFSKKDETAFDKTLTMLVNDKALRDQLGHAAKESLIKKELTWAGNARRIGKIAEKLAGAHL